VKKGITAPVSWVDETGMIYAGVSHGNRNMYNVYYGGYNAAQNTVGLGLAIGVRWIFSSSWLSTDINSVIEGARTDLRKHYKEGTRKEQYNGGLSQVAGLRIMAGITFFERLSVFAGASANTSITYYFEGKNSSDRPRPLTGYYFKKGSTDKVYYQCWPGFFAGMQFALQ
jgi:hypothetical protein